MATEKQVKQIAIELATYDGSFTALLGYPKTYDVWNFDARWRTDWLGGNATTRALTGFDRQNPGGYRADIRISFQNMTTTQATALRGLFNDIYTDPMFPAAIRISPDNDISKAVACNILSGAFGIRRELTVGLQRVNAQFSGMFRLPEVPDSFIIGPTA